MASLKFSEWSDAVTKGVAALVTIGTIIGIYAGVSAWADEKLEQRVSQAELAAITSMAEAQARNSIDHDKIVQRTRLVEAEANLKVTDLQLQILEDDIAEREEQGLEPTARQARQMDRLLKVVETYEQTQSDATMKLTKITTTTTTTTTTEPDQ